MARAVTLGKWARIGGECYKRLRKHSDVPCGDFPFFGEFLAVVAAKRETFIDAGHFTSRGVNGKI